MEELNQAQNNVLDYVYKKVLVSVSKINTRKGSKTIHPKDFFGFSVTAFNSGDIHLKNVRHYLRIDDIDVGMLIAPSLHIYSPRIGVAKHSTEIKGGQRLEDMYIHASARHKLVYKIKHEHSLTIMLYDDLPPGACSIIYVPGIAVKPGVTKVRYKAIADVSTNVLSVEDSQTAFAEAMLDVVKRV